MRRTSAITYGVTGQTLTLRVPNGKPTSATFYALRQYALDENVAEFSGAATVDTVDTAITVAAGPAQSDPQLLTVPVAGFIVGQRYLLAANSVTEWVDVVEIGTTTIRVRFPLQRDYPIGATIKGCYLTAAVDNAFAASLNKMSDLIDTTPDFRVKWTILVGGVTIVVYSFFDLVRSPASAHVDIADVNERAFGLVDSLPIEYRTEDGKPIIEGAWRAVRADLIAQGVSPDAWRDDEALDELVVRRTLLNLAKGGWKPAGWDLGSYLTMVNDDYDRFLEQHVVTLKHPTSTQIEAWTNPWAKPPQKTTWSK